MEDTEWKYSNEIDNGFTQPEEGPQYLVIENATYDEIEDTYTLNVRSLTNEASIRLKYWLSRFNDDTGEIVPDARQRRTLISLKKALYGPDANGIPNPENIVGCVAMADVKLKAPNAKGVRYANVFTFEPVVEDIALSFGKDGQYFVPSEGEEQTAVEEQ